MLCELDMCLSQTRATGDCAKIEVAVTASRGYHITLPGTLDILPEEVCLAVRQNKSIIASTYDLISLNNRVKVCSTVCPGMWVLWAAVSRPVH